VTIRLAAVSSPTPAPAMVVLGNGTRIECTLLSADDETVKVRSATGKELTFDRVQVTRIDMH